MEKKFKLNAAMINKNRAFLLLAIVLFCGLFVDNFYTAYNIRAVTGNGSLVIGWDLDLLSSSLQGIWI